MSLNGLVFQSSWIQVNHKFVILPRYNKERVTKSVCMYIRGFYTIAYVFFEGSVKCFVIVCQMNCFGISLPTKLKFVHIQLLDIRKNSFICLSAASKVPQKLVPYLLV